MIVFIHSTVEVSTQVDLQILDRGYGQIETYSFGKQLNKQFLSPAQNYQLYGEADLQKADGFLRSLVSKNSQDRTTAS